MPTTNEFGLNQNHMVRDRLRDSLDCHQSRSCGTGRDWFSREPAGRDGTRDGPLRDGTEKSVPCRALAGTHRYFSASRASPGNRSWLSFQKRSALPEQLRHFSPRYVSTSDVNCSSSSSSSGMKSKRPRFLGGETSNNTTMFKCKIIIVPDILWLRIYTYLYVYSEIHHLIILL